MALLWVMSRVPDIGGHGLSVLRISLKVGEMSPVGKSLINTLMGGGISRKSEVRYWRIQVGKEVKYEYPGP